MTKEKKSHGVQLLIRTVVKDPDGKVLSDTGQKPSKSFVIQFLEFIRYLFDATGANRLATDINGAEDEIYSDLYTCAVHSQVDATLIEYGVNYGVVVGTGDTAKTNTDYKLETKLTEGVGAGNITHGVVTIGTTAVVGANVDLEIKRPFTNNTGSTIIVKEAGIYTKYKGAGAPAAGNYHCIIRDVLPASVNVPDRCSLTVYYTIRTTV